MIQYLVNCFDNKENIQIRFPLTPHHFLILPQFTLFLKSLQKWLNLSQLQFFRFLNLRLPKRQLPNF